MKKNYLWLFLPLLAIGCSQVETEDILNTNNTNLKTKDGEIAKLKQRCTIHIEDIRSYEALTNNEKETKIISEITPIICDQDTVLYVVNYDNNKGWTLYPSDKRAPAILASSKTGNYFQQNNDPINEWTGFTVENIYNLKNSSQCDTLTADFEMWNNIQKPILKGTTTRRTEGQIGAWHLVSVTSRSIGENIIGPLAKTTWHQNYPWNQCVPECKNKQTRCKAGCVAIAGAQCVYALHKALGIPKSFYSTGACYGWSAGSQYDFSFVFDNISEECWSQMALHSSDGIEACKHSAILIGYVGREAKVQWNEDSSGTKTEELVNVLKKLGIDSNYGGYDTAKILSTLKNNCPVIIRGCLNKETHHILGIPAYTEYTNGHAWLIDGYQKRTYKYTYTYQWLYDDPDIDILLDPSIHSTRYTKNISNNEIPAIKVKTSTNYSSSEYITMNWGWGSSNRPIYSFNRYNENINFDGFKYQLKIITGYKPLENN